MQNDELLEMAKTAMKNAYAPYSHFLVGTALLCKNGDVYTGCNVENASFGATNCAERTAVFNAVSHGVRDFEKIAIVSLNDELTYPCGICRQVLSEFNKDIKVVLQHREQIKECSLRELFPDSFDLAKG